MISDSLLASARVLPASRAAIVGRRPTAPVMPLRTTSHSRARRRPRRSPPARRTRARTRRPGRRTGRAATAGGQPDHPEPVRVGADDVERLGPIDPVEPRMTTSRRSLTPSIMSARRHRPPHLPPTPSPHFHAPATAPANPSLAPPPLSPHLPSHPPHLPNPAPTRHRSAGNPRRAVTKVHPDTAEPSQRCSQTPPSRRKRCNRRLHFCDGSAQRGLHFCDGSAQLGCTSVTGRRLRWHGGRHGQKRWTGPSKS